MVIDKKIFILIFGHGRSGTTLCTGLLNQSPELHLGYELFNNFYIKEFWENKKDEGDTLSCDYNGNKIVLHYNLSYKEVMRAINQKKYFIHGEFKDLKVIFTERNPFANIISQKIRWSDKKGRDIPISEVVSKYIASHRVLIQLKKTFPGYHVFDFDRAVGCEFHRKWLFDYVGKPYRSIYSDTFGGVNNYAYGSIRRENIQVGLPEKHPEMVAEIQKRFDGERFWPWAAFKA